MSHSTFDKVLEQSKQLHIVHGIESLLDWDREVMMPESASEGRGQELKFLSGLAHKMALSKKFTKPLFELIDEGSGEILDHTLDEGQKACLREWRRNYRIQSALPQKFVESFAELASNANHVWRIARKEKNYALFAPYLQKIIDANRKKAKYIGYTEHPYDALLDLYEQGMTTKSATELFNGLKGPLVQLLERIRKQPQVDTSILFGNFPTDPQLAFCKKVLEALGFDWTRERLDLSTHPFCSSSQPNDCRITTRIDTKDLFNCLSSVLHEAGHALYDLGLPKEKWGSPLGDSVSMGIHESQSRFWETRIGLSLPFAAFILPLAKEAFPGSFAKANPASLHKALNKVEPSFIRVEADEVTYPLHIILRFEIEKQFLEGSLDAKDLPDAWNAKMKELLGIVPSDDALGCLQDVHWSGGAMGYFPTYSLGNLYAAQLFETFEKAHPDWKSQVESGRFAFIREFLNEKIYRWGHRYNGPELIRLATGAPLSPDAYIRYLNGKYRSIYSITD
ncbi:MAG: carboxypeptidase M32 [Parachlamydiaceae bacterium]